ncbi:MAG: thioesterase family protein [Acidobacteriia bacterium]|nr:thioesterase family protein [Terriglobia bacterium]
MPLQEPKVFEKIFAVTDDLAVHFLGSQVTPALSTPGLVLWMELTSRENVASLLKEGEDTVGVSVSIKHLAPTPVGMKVRVVSRLMNVEGRIYSFEVEAYDEVEKIGEATHTRAAVAVAKFASRIKAKSSQSGGKLPG